MAFYENAVVQREAERILKILRVSIENIAEITHDSNSEFAFSVGGNTVNFSVDRQLDAALISSFRLPANYDRRKLSESLCLLNLCLDFAKIVVSFEANTLSLVSVFCCSDSIFSPSALNGWLSQFVNFTDIIFANVGKIAAGQDLEAIADNLCDVIGVGDRKSALDCLGRFASNINKRGWNALCDDGNLFLNVRNGGKCVNFSFTYNCDYSYVAIVGAFSLDFGSCKADCAELVCRLNEALQYGCLDFDYETGKAYYRSSLPVARCLIAESLCGKIIDRCCEEAFEVNDKLEKLLCR